MHTDLLTICIPVFERYDFFEEAIASAINQTVTCKIIVSDNGSSHNKFEQYCINNNIEYHRNETNIGMFPNWNKCFNYASTPYVMIFGDDDVLHRSFVEQFLNKEKQYGGLDFYYTDIDLLVNGKKEDWDCPALYGFFDKNLDLLELAANEKVGIPSISGVFKRDIMIDNPLPDTYHGSNDWLWLYSNLDKLKVYGNEQKLLVYRRHNQQDSTSNNFVSYFWSYPVIYYIIYEKLRNKSNLANKVFHRSIWLGLQSILMFEFKFYDYYHSAEESNIYKRYYRDKISKHSLPLYLMAAPKQVGYWGLRIYFKIYNLLKSKFLIP